MFANLLWAGLLMLQGQGNDVGWDLVSMWHNMGWPAKTVVLILFIMSAWSVGIMIDRALMYSAARKQSRVFVQQVAGALKTISSTKPSPSPSATRKAISPRLSPPAFRNFRPRPRKSAMRK